MGLLLLAVFRQADRVAALRVAPGDGRAVLPADQAAGRVVREDDPREGAGHAAAAEAGAGTDRAVEFAPSRLRA